MADWTIVLGLGNPGARYRATRHNVGFMVVDRLAASAGVETVLDPNLAGRAWTAETAVDGRAVVLARPRTFMNRSGRAARALAERYEVAPESFVVVYDDADLELGRVRVRGDGGHGGHNGIRSLLATWGEPRFARVRIGVRGAGREDSELADYVLAPFDDDERATVDALLELGADAVRAVVGCGVTAAMNEFNGRRAAPEPNDGRGIGRAEEREQS